MKPGKKIVFSKDNVVLVVEDNLITQELISKIFSHFGLSVHLANNGEEGVEMARRLKPDMILMDIFMPVMNGVDATRLIRQEPQIKDTLSSSSLPVPSGMRRTMQKKRA